MPLLHQNELLLEKLMKYYNEENLNKMLSIINGESNISLRIIDWFTTNYSKKNFTIFDNQKQKRFNV